MKESNCEWAESCDCSSPSANKDKSCEKCKWYWMIDSGYGHCKALPQHITVAWCRDICSLFEIKDAPEGG